MRTIRLASGNELINLRQAARLERTLEEKAVGVGVIALPVDCGDRPTALLEIMGERLHRGEIEAAVCPAGLLSAGLPPGVDVGAVFKDNDPAYHWVACGPSELATLPSGAAVITWDDVSRAQILFHHPELQVESARGWTKVFEGLRHGAWAAACLPPEVLETGSLWGLNSSAVEPGEVKPAIGQGAAAILVPSGTVDPLLRSLNDPEMELRLRLESIFWWNAMDVPGTVATAGVSLEGDRLVVEGIIVEAEGQWLIEDSAEGAVQYGETIARDVADSCRELAQKRLSRAAEPVPGRAAS